MPRAGSERFTELLLTAASASRLIWFADVNCQTCETPLPAKFARFTVVVAVLVDLLITITVKAPSPVRSDANAETLSGFAAAAETLVSPNPFSSPS